MQAVALAPYVALRGSLTALELVALGVALAYPLAALAMLRAGVSRGAITIATTVAATLATTAFCAATGGLRSPCMVLFATIPTGSVSYGGPRSALRMIAITGAALVALAALEAFGALPASALPAAQWPRIAFVMTAYAVVTVGLTALGAEAKREHVKQTLSRALDRAEGANRVKSQFLAMMSHELRTPMTGVIGMVDLLRGTAMSDEQTGYVDTLRSSAEALLVTLNDILDLSKIEAGQLALEAVAFDPATITREVAALFTPAAARRSVALEARVDSSVPPQLVGDPNRVRQVITNLVGNAVKFTTVGKIDVAIRYDASSRAGDGRGRLVIEVRDTGIGIRPEAFAHLFQPFQQADESTARKFGGTGLGLAICKRLCEAMEGSIEVESELGRGSVFRCHFALRPYTPDASGESRRGFASGAAPSEGTPPSRGCCALRILVAEDNPVNQMVIRKALERRGHQVTVVENGALALEAVQETRFDLLLIDMQMPVMDGAEATRAIRRLGGRPSAMPIYALSADVVAERREAYLAAGLDGFLRKPIEWGLLEAVLSSIVPADDGDSIEGSGETAAPTAHTTSR